MPAFALTDFPHTRHITDRGRLNGRLNFSRLGRSIQLNPAGSDTIVKPAEFIPTFYLIAQFLNFAGTPGQKGTVKLDIISGGITEQGTPFQVTMPASGTMRIEARRFVEVDPLSNLFSLSASLGGFSFVGRTWELVGALTATA